jgi:hypothetical protein
MYATLLDGLSGVTALGPSLLHQIKKPTAGPVGFLRITLANARAID